MRIQSKTGAFAINRQASTPKTVVITALLLASMISPHSYGNGLAINEQSASAAGTAYAGRSSSAIDASTVYGNPAGLTKLKSRQVVSGLSVVIPKDEISDVESSATGTSKGNSIPVGVIPFAYFSQPINDRVSFGLGFYATAGLVNDYESTFQGRYYGSYSDTKIVTLQPTIAFKLTDRVSFGFGPTINRIDGKLQNYLATGPLNNGTETRLSITGDDTALGYNVGILFDISDAATIGLTYHSKVNFHLKGKTKVTGAPDGFDINGSYDASLDIVYPEFVDTSLTYRFNNKWTGYLGTSWTRWSRFQSFDIYNKTPDTAVGNGLSKVVEPLRWKDTWSISIGAAYQINNEWQLRAGMAYDPSPAHNANRNVRIPTGNRKAFTVGAGYSPTSDITVDFAYGYIWESEASVSQSDSSGLCPSYNATYQNSANGITT
ncbi:outer membrane protein transport protein [Pseudomonas sp. GM17]|uniref:OmpP1/FadL family transporter n=1 Tax=Pseudomonas sp. GM17 TaxID=1144323 RepID=UPI00027244BE|nr:outer membrane protein transport protein [Pseudomonas sp. GM17]WIE49817.1 outer membrane protein transport protein [Pseudomonas sp. GM17]